MTAEQKRVPAFQRGVRPIQWQQEHGARWDPSEVSRHYDQLHRIRREAEKERERRRQVKRGK